MSIENTTRARRTRTDRLQAKRRGRSAYVAAATALAVAFVALATSAIMLEGPSTAFATTEDLPQGAIGIGAQTAPAATALTGAMKVGTPRSQGARGTQIKAFAKAVKKKKAWDAEQARKRRLAEARRRAAAALQWKSAFCSTYGIGDGLVGSGMANGQRLRSDSMVVAHKTLPFGTKIKFSYRGRTAIATVTDRGPYIHGRVFDLGPGTAKALGFNGIGYVKYAIIKK